MNLMVIEDRRVNQLAPITSGRPAYAISCGSYRLIDFLKQLSDQVNGVVRDHLLAIQANDFGLSADLDRSQPTTMIVSARVAPSLKNCDTLAELVRLASRSDLEQSWSVLATDSRHAVAALVPTERLTELTSVSQWSTVFESPLVDGVSNQSSTLEVFDYPHDVIRIHMACVASNLEFRLMQGDYESYRPGVYMTPTSPAAIDPTAVFDTTGGPVLLEQGVLVGPHSFFRGPVYVGPHSKISEHASIKDGVSIGSTCKIGGEVEGCIIESYSNKQHYGFLGHAYLGSWINLGAGTCNSDLKNTYGLVNMEYQGQKVSTGMQFVGCVIGDYAKTAINTSIFTGKMIGVGSMAYGLVGTNVGDFVNYAKSMGQLGLLPPEVIIKTQQRMFERRSVPQRDCDIQLIRDMFRLTASSRPADLSEAPLTF